jgi:hypothetical protein
MDQDYDIACYPRWRYHRTLPAVIVPDVDADRALGPDWADTPAAFYASEHTPEVSVMEPRRRGRPKREV